MASFLENSLAKQIAKGFKGKLLTGTLSRPSGSTVDSFGDVVLGPPANYTVEGFVDNYTDSYKAAAGIPSTDVKIVLIAGNTTITPKKGDTVTLRAKTYEVRVVTRDPAIATFECQAFEVK